MADKLTQQILDALSKAAADPGALPLYAGKTEPGLFPATAKPAAQKCLADRLIQVARTDSSGRSPRELYALTETGWEFLLASVNPKHVLEDFVRVMEARRGEVTELLATARTMAEHLQGLKDAVARVLPHVTVNRIAVRPAPEDRAATNDAEPLIVTRSNGNAVQAPPTLAAAVLARLAEWAAAANAAEDCPLPELYRGLSQCSPPPTIGEFHDCLRQLRAEQAIHLHPWTAPLYALPEPACALLDGHNVAYYASLQRGRS